ncbi:MAG: acetyltransferase [Erysipelotrichaceae bacterium]
MEKIYIVGASGFGREVAWLIEQLGTYNIAGFVDDNEKIQNSFINGLQVVGKIEYLINIKTMCNVVIAIANPNIRQRIAEKLQENTCLRFPNIIAKNANMSKYVELGVGNVICDNTIITTNVKIGSFNHLNLSCTIGHDAVLADYITVYPSVNISGAVSIDNYSELGTGSKIIQGINITNSVIIGAGSVVIRDLQDSGTYVGIPVKRIK